MTDRTKPKGLIATSVSRRSFLSAGALSAAAPLALHALQPAEAKAQALPVDPRTAVPVVLKVNGITHSAPMDIRTSLLDAIRERIGLTGTKKGCDHGQCGACTVHVDGRRTLSCLTLAVAAQGAEILTIEGLSGDDAALHPMQQAFIDNDAFQCGYCTPGQIMSAVACVQEGHAQDDAEIREYMSGNLCRCAAYPNIVAAVRQAASKMERA